MFILKTYHKSIENISKEVHSSFYILRKVTFCSSGLPYFCCAIEFVYMCEHTCVCVHAHTCTQVHTLLCMLLI